MRNMKIRSKLLLSFIIVAIMALIVGSIGAIMLYSTDTSYSKELVRNNEALMALADLREAYQQERANIREVIIAIPSGSEAVEKAIKTFQEESAYVSDSFTAYEKTITDKIAEAAFYTAQDTYEGAFTTAVSKVVQHARAGDYNGAEHALEEAASVAGDIAAGLAATVTYSANLADEESMRLTNESIMTMIIQIVVAVIAVVTAIALGLYISGLISKPLIILTSFMNKAGSTGDISLRQEDVEIIGRYAGNKDETGQCISSTANFVKHITDISEELGLIADGDLTVHVKCLSERDTIGVSIQKMVDNLNGMFSEINASTAQVSNGSKQIADGSQSLAQGSTEQAAAVEQLSSSISEIAQKTKDNADMAGKAAVLADTIKKNAEKGSRQMNEMMGAVREINEASQSINKVIKVIDDIAFQTNILALNAAVEAARAGQHGKGFAVVAEEVRSLAAKSADAAKDTGGLIANAMEKAELGARIADETAASLIEIVSGINESSLLVGEIARSSEEQSAGISQINTGIDQVAQVIQQNSATAEESAAASEEMSGQADMLEQLISQFKLKEDGITQKFSSFSADNQTPAKRIVMPKKTAYAHNGEYGKY